MSLVDLNVPDGSETDQVVQDEDCANETQIPAYNYFKFGHIFTGEVSRNRNSNSLISLLNMRIRSLGYPNDSAANLKGFL